MARIGGEDIEDLTLKPYEAVTAIGAGKFKAFSRTVIIELLPGYLSNSLYVLEANIRHAAILGYVGAGGTVKRPTKEGPAMVFNNVKGHKDARVAIGVLASRKRVAALLDCKPEELGKKLYHSVDNPIAPVESAGRS